MFDPKRIPCWLAAGLLSLGLGAAAAQPTSPAAAPPPAEAAPSPSAPKFIRVTDSEDRTRLRMEVVIRHFEPADGDGPSIDLVGAAHIGDQSFYDTLQAHLDGKDVVLFEGVKPAAAVRLDEASATDEQRADRTRKRIRLIAAIAEAYRDEKGEYPDSVARLAAAKDKRIAYLVSTAADDGWGRPLMYTRAPDEPRGIELRSLG